MNVWGWGLVSMFNKLITATAYRGVGRGRALGAGAPPFSAKTTLRAPPSLMSLQGITGID